jgi:hypothetical protein
MKRNILSNVLLGAIGLVAIGMISGMISLTANGGTEAYVEEAAVRYGSQRPFSFYYPYSYQYYTPHKSYSKSYYGSSSCYWRYMNGSYVYFCQ